LSLNEHSTTTEALIRQGLLFIGDGYRAKNSELSTDGLPFARAGNIDGGFNFESADRFPRNELGKVGNKLSQPGDVVFTSKGSVGRFAFVTESVEPFVYSPQLCFWRSLNTELIRPRFLYYWMHSEEFLDQVDALKGQTDMADYVSLTDQRRMRINLSPVSEQDAIIRILEPLDERIDVNTRLNKALINLRINLLTPLISGELRVKEIERDVGQAVR
jgi:type I restriction enzyme S subunit